MTMVEEQQGQKFKGRIRVKQGACPNGHSLMSDDRLFDGEQAVKVKAIAGGHSGLLYLNPFYGKFEYESEIPLNEGEII
jgi:hypothetical protein